MRITDEQITHLIGVTTNHEQAQLYGEAIKLRQIECVTKAANQLLGDVGDSWHDGVDIHDTAVQKKVGDALRQLSFPITDEQLAAQLHPVAAGNLQDVFILASWLEKNPCRVTSGPIFKRHAEFKSLLTIVGVELALMDLGVQPTDWDALNQRAAQAYHNIRKPTQAQRYQ